MGGIKRTRTGLLLKKEGDRNMGSRSKEEQTEGHMDRNLESGYLGSGNSSDIIQN